MEQVVIGIKWSVQCSSRKGRWGHGTGKLACSRSRWKGGCEREDDFFIPYWQVVVLLPDDTITCFFFLFTMYLTDSKVLLPPSYPTLLVP